MTVDYFAVIKKKKVVEKLDKTYKKNYEILVNTFAGQLDAGPKLSEIGFTAHDFSHHVVDILDIYGAILPDSFFKEKKDSLYILLVATLFHDYGMLSEWTTEVREKHSKLSRDWFLKCFDKGKRNDIIPSRVNSAYKEAIADIIWAHSDEKDCGETKVYTFNSVCENYEKNQNIIQADHNPDEVIDVPFLAAVLRLGDELDISINRIKGENDISHNIASSEPHFELCSLITSITTNAEKTKIIIVPDKTACDWDKIEDPNTTEDEKLEIARKAALILERYEKILREYRNLSNRALHRTTHSSEKLWKIRDIELNNSQELKGAVKKKRILLSINDSIRDEVLGRSLFKSGHFRLVADKKSIRDWVDFEGLVSNGPGYFELFEGKNEEVNKIVKGKDLLIGVNRYGSLAAARWGYKYKIPFSYFFEDREIVDSLEHNILTNGGKEILVIVDVVVTGNTVNKVIERLKALDLISEDSIIDILVLFERFSGRKRSDRTDRQGYYFSSIYSNPCIHKIFVANDSFEIEICRKNPKDCLFSKESKCSSCGSCEQSFIFDDNELMDL